MRCLAELSLCVCDNLSELLIALERAFEMMLGGLKCDALRDVWMSMRVGIV